MDRENNHTANKNKQSKYGKLYILLDILASIYRFESFNCFEVLKLGVIFFNSERSFEIRSDVFEFLMMFSNLERSFRIRSELLELRVNF